MVNKTHPKKISSHKKHTLLTSSVVNLAAGVSTTREFLDAVAFQQAEPSKSIANITERLSDTSAKQAQAFNQEWPCYPMPLRHLGMPYTLPRLCTPPLSASNKDSTVHTSSSQTVTDQVSPSQSPRSGLICPQSDITQSPP